MSNRASARRWPPSARLSLASLGLWERFERQGHAPSYAIRSAWGEPQLYEQDFTFHPYGTGWHLDRQLFDGMIADAAEEAGATVYRGGRLEDNLQEECGWLAGQPETRGRGSPIPGFIRCGYHRASGFICAAAWGGQESARRTSRRPRVLVAMFAANQSGVLHPRGSEGVRMVVFGLAA